MSRPFTGARDPYPLHALLKRHRIQQGELRRAICFDHGGRKGQPIADSTLSSLLVQRKWPVRPEREVLRRQVADFLTAKGVPAADIDSCWDGDVLQLAPPPMVTDEQREARRAQLAIARSMRRDSKPEEPEPFYCPEPEMLTAAAREHFRLFVHPFKDDVHGPKDVYLSADQRYIRESMFYAAKHAGIVAVIGESGSGKTTLRRDLVERIRRDAEPITIIQPQTIDKTVLTAAHISDAIISDLSSEPPKQQMEAKARQIKRILAASAKNGQSHVVIIEEAHDVSNATLKYLKRFWEMEDGFKQLLGIILVAQPELADRLDERKNPDLREFIRRCEIATLKPLNGNLEEYLSHKFKRIDRALDDIYDKDAFDAIRAKLTRRRVGSNDIEANIYPLIVQNLTIRAMNLAVAIGMPKVNADLIARV